MRKEEQRYKRGLKTLFIIDFLIVIVPILFFLIMKTSFAFGVLTNDTEYSDARYENVYIDLAEEGEKSGRNVARLGYTWWTRQDGSQTENFIHLLKVYQEYPWH